MVNDFYAAAYASGPEIFERSVENIKGISPVSPFAFSVFSHILLQLSSQKSHSQFALTIRSLIIIVIINQRFFCYTVVL
jgi:hypothetical protein